MRDKSLVVSLPARRVGTLTQNRSGLTRWSPDAPWEYDGQIPRLGLEFLRRPGARTNASELPSWFENLLPERGTELRERLAAAAELREGQSFELLHTYGRDLIGAVEVRDLGTSGEPADAQPTTPVPFAALPAEGDNEGATTQMSALTGVQLKFSMSMVNERLVMPARGHARAWLVKIAGEQYPELAAVEHITMAWAARCGHTVPNHFVVRIDRLDGIPSGWIRGDAPAFAVERFDRREDGTKIHQEDLCQALDLRPQDKYGNRAVRVSFEGALRLVLDVCGESDAREMARRIGFMLASGNTDAHLKNWSLVWGDRTRPTLSPCYDLVSTISWPERMGWRIKHGPTLALRLSSKTRFSQISVDVIEQFANATASFAKDEIIAGVERARVAWGEVAAGAPPRMRESLAEHWDAVPLLAAMGGLPT